MHYFSLEQPHCEIVSSDWSIMVVGHLLLCLTRCWSLPLPFSLLLKNPNWMMNSRMGAKWNTLSSLVGLKSRKKRACRSIWFPCFFPILKKIYYMIQSMSKEENTGGISFWKENLKRVSFDLKILEKCSNNDVWRSFLIVFGRASCGLSEEKLFLK